MCGSVVHRDARYERISESRTDVESFVHQDARYARKNTPKNHRTSFRTEVESFVQQNARDNMESRYAWKTRRWANVKQCKLKVWGVAVVDLWLFFAYHAKVKV